MLTVLLTLAIIGLVVWLITTYIPMPPVFRTVIIVLAVLFLIYYLLQLIPGIDSRLMF